MLTPHQVLDHYYLEARCQLLEIAAMLDRHDFAQREQGDQPSEARLERIYQSLAVLAQRQSATDRSERLLNLFSNPS